MSAQEATEVNESHRDYILLVAALMGRRPALTPRPTTLTLEACEPGPLCDRQMRLLRTSDTDTFVSACRAAKREWDKREGHTHEDA